MFNQPPATSTCQEYLLGLTAKPSSCVAQFAAMAFGSYSWAKGARVAFGHDTSRLFCSTGNVVEGGKMSRIVLPSRFLWGPRWWSKVCKSFCLFKNGRWRLQPPTVVGFLSVSTQFETSPRVMLLASQPHIPSLHEPWWLAFVGLYDCSVISIFCEKISGDRFAGNGPCPGTSHLAKSNDPNSARGFGTTGNAGQRNWSWWC